MNCLTATFLLLACFAAVKRVSAKTCPEGQSAFGDCCYKVYKSASTCSRDFTFNDANEYCQATGGELVSIHSDEENKFVKHLIKHTQSTCKREKKDFVYWIGLQLSRAPNGLLDGTSWTDATPVDYGNPLSSSDFQPPFLDDAPSGLSDSDLGEVCAGCGKRCTQMIGFGKEAGRWVDANCSAVHHQTVNHCERRHKPTNVTSKPSPSPVAGRQSQLKKLLAGNAKTKEDVSCRIAAATSGFVCKYCDCGCTTTTTTTTTTTPSTTTTTTEPSTTTTTTPSTTTTTTPSTTTTTTTPTTTTTTTPSTTTTTTTPTTTSTTTSTTTTTTTTVFIPVYACLNPARQLARCCGPANIICTNQPNPASFTCTNPAQLNGRCCGNLGLLCENATQIN